MSFLFISKIKVHTLQYIPTKYNILGIKYNILTT